MWSRYWPLHSELPLPTGGELLGSVSRQPTDTLSGEEQVVQRALGAPWHSNLSILVGMKRNRLRPSKLTVLSSHCLAVFHQEY